jgi:cardiolipin synthase
LVNYASLSYFEELMQAGVRFYSYQKGFIHAKVLIIDDILASVGTANMDMRSFFSNFELNAVLFDKETIQRLEGDFLQDLKESKELKLEVFVNRSRLKKGKEIAARLLSPLF